DGVARGTREDRSGDAIASWAARAGHVVAARACVPDDAERIATALAAWADLDRADVVLTTGGTGFTARDVTPEATRSVREPAPPCPVGPRVRAMEWSPGRLSRTAPRVSQPHWPSGPISTAPTSPSPPAAPA